MTAHIPLWSPAEIVTATIRSESRKRTGKLPTPTLSAAVTWQTDRASWRGYGLETAKVAIQRKDGSVPSKRTVQRQAKPSGVYGWTRAPNRCAACRELGHRKDSKKCPKASAT